MVVNKTVAKFAFVSTVSLALILATACLEASSSAVSGTISQSSGMGFGGSDDGIMVSLIEVVSDSRCAEGVTCPSAGKADIKIGISVNSAPESEVTLELAPGSETPYETGDYTITLMMLLPEPPPVGGVEQADYQLELSIERD